MINISDQIVQCHYFGNKIVVKTRNETIRLNQEMASIFDIVLNYMPISIEDITERYRLVRSISTDKICDLRQILKEFILNSTMGQKLFKVSENDSSINSILISGVKEKFIPLTLNLELTNKCNLKCTHCYKNAVIESDKFLALEKIMLLFRSLNPKGIAITLTGGEPTLHPEFSSIVSYLSDFGKIDMATNGTNLCRIDSNALKKIDLICISLYGTTNELYYKNTGIINGLELIEKSVEKLKKLGNKFNMSIVLDKEKIENMQSYVEFACKCGASNFQIGIPAHAGRLAKFNSKNNLWELTQDDLKYAYIKQRQLQKEYKDKIEIVTWDRSVYETKYSYNDPLNPCNFYPPHCMRCGAGVLHWVVSEKFEFRPCALMPETFTDAIFSFDDFLNYINGDLVINWETIMCNFKKECELNGNNAADYCENFVSFLYDTK